MLIAPTTTGQHLPVPLTHLQCMTASAKLAADGAIDTRPRVQVQRHHSEGPYRLCAQVVALLTGGAELFKVDTAIDTFWANGQNLRLCSGDGRCTCETVTVPGCTSTEPSNSTSSATVQKAQQPYGLQPGCDIQPSGQST